MRSLLILAAAAAAIVATPAFAQDPAARIVVRHADLNLASPAGLATLDRRISAAVREACGPTSDVDPAGKNRARACRTAMGAVVRGQREHVVAAATRSNATVLASTH